MLAAHQRRETISRRGAGAPVREIAPLPSMLPITCDPTNDPADPGNQHCVQYANVLFSR
jgi:hypothetical protein